VGAIVALIIFLRLCKETRLRVKHAIFRDELYLKRLSSNRLATNISLVLRRLLGL
jgi:hypothetical protein